MGALKFAHVNEITTEELLNSAIGVLDTDIR